MKKLIKKIEAVVLVIALLLSSSVLCVSAAEAKTFTWDLESSSFTIGTDEYVTVSVQNTDQVGIAGMRFYLYCDTSVFAIDDISLKNGYKGKGSGYDYEVINNSSDKDGYVVIWWKTEDISDVDMCDIYLTVDENTINDDYEILLAAYDANDADENSVDIVFTEKKKVTISGGVSADDFKPQIKSEPQDANYIYNPNVTTATLTVGADVTSSSAVLTYQWYNADGSVATGEGATSATFTPALPAVGGAASYYCVVTATSSMGTFTAQTRTAVVTHVAADMEASLLSYNIPPSCTYDKAAHAATVTAASGVTGLGAITVKYNGSETAPVNAGTYMVTVDVAAGTNYNAITGLELGSFTISPVQVTVPTVASNLTYNNKAQDGVVSADETIYTVSNGTKTDAGNYEATAELVDKTNYVWADTKTADNKTFNWSIAKADVTIEASNISVVKGYSGTIVATAKGAEGTALTSELTYALKSAVSGITVTGNQVAVAAGVAENSYAVVISYAESTNFKAASKEINVIVTSKLENSVTLAAGATEKTYSPDGYAISTFVGAPTVGFPEGGAAVGTGTYTYTVTGPEAGTYTAAEFAALKVTTAGKYAVTVKYEDDKYLSTSTAVEFEITKATVTATANDITVNYGDEMALTGTASVEGTWAWNQDISAMTDAGTYKDVKVKFTPKDSTNYAAKEDTITVTIKKLQIVEPIAKTDLTFKGSAQIGIIAESISGNVEWDSTSHSAAQTNAGNYVTVFVLKDTVNYEWAEGSDGVVNWTIAKAAAPAAATASVQYKYVVEGEREITVNLPADAGTITYTNITADDIGGVLTSYELNGTTAKIVLSGSAKAGDVATITAAVKMQNYEDTTLTITIKMQDKDIPEVVFNNVVVDYTGKEIPASAITGKANVAGTWAWAQDVSGMINANTYKDVKVKFVPTDSVNYAEVEEVITVTINKVNPTGEPAYTKITAANKTLADAALNVGTITPAGTIAWNDGDATVVEANKAYKWTFTPADTTNYNVRTGEIVPYPHNSFFGYFISVVPSENGSLKFNTNSATSGVVISFVANPAAGYEVSAIRIVDANGNVVPVTNLGNGKYSFSMPNSNVTVSATFAVAGERKVFIDVEKADWFYDEVYYAYDNGLMNGISEKLFAPETYLTRGMLMTILARLDGVNTNGGATWYTKGMEWAKANGISDGTNPEGLITREQTVTMLYRYAQYKGIDVSVGENTNILSYGDAFSISEWAIPAMQWACGESLVQGNAGKLNPLGNATRAEIATMLMRFIENVIK